MPHWLLESYMENMPKIEARESLSMATAVSVGTGSMKKQQSKEIVRRWERSAGRSNTVRGLSSADVAAMHGIGVVVEEKQDV